VNSVDKWFDTIYLENYEKLFKLAFRLLGDWELAQDIVQMAFLILLTKYDQMQRHSNISGWLVVTVKNLIHTEQQKAYRQLEVPLPSEYEPMAADPPPDFLSTLPEGLSEEERWLLYLCYEAELPHKEIAAQLGCTSAACGMRLYRARQHCRELLKKK